jgi:hypothetical protein
MSKYGPKLEQQYWRYCENMDHWADGSFSCANGFGNIPNNDEDDGDDGTGSYRFSDGLFDRDKDPSDWPYQVQVIADCETDCQLIVDSNFSRNTFFKVKKLKPNIVLYGLAATTFATVGLLMLRSARRNPSSSIELPSNEGGVSA